VFIVLGCLVTLVLANDFRYKLTTVGSNDAGVDGSDEGTELNGEEKSAGNCSGLSAQTLAGVRSVILVRIV
jgi:hypothetical protein